MAKDSFKFKQFSVSHLRSSMKVGIDAVLLGAWADVSDSKDHHLEGLDIGCGCGVIALMIAQRFPGANITGIDIDLPSIEETRANFNNSRWRERLSAVEGDATLWVTEQNINRYDFIVSNPPYFSSGIVCPETSRERARHQDTLTPAKLIEIAAALLNDEGTLSLILPSDSEVSVIEYGIQTNLFPKKICRIRGRDGKEINRVMITFKKCGEELPEEPSYEDLTIRHGNEAYTPEYIALTKDFYLHDLNENITK